MPALISKKNKNKSGFKSVTTFDLHCTLYIITSDLYSPGLIYYIYSRNERRVGGHRAEVVLRQSQTNIFLGRHHNLAHTGRLKQFPEVWRKLRNGCSRTVLSKTKIFVDTLIETTAYELRRRASPQAEAFYREILGIFNIVRTMSPNFRSTDSSLPESVSCFRKH